MTLAPTPTHRDTGHGQSDGTGLEQAGRGARGLVASKAQEWGCEPAALLAVIEVESAGRIFARVKGRSEPLIRFEGHWFHRLLPELEAGASEASGVSRTLPPDVSRTPLAGARWRLLDARRGDRPQAAALSSCSWGLGQVMGFHWRRLGYGSVDALVAEARSGAAGQIGLMARFVDDAGLASALVKRDWHRFARRYNGPLYARHGYHSKLAAAYARAKRLDLSVEPTLPRVAHEGDGLRFGARGPRVRLLQRALSRAGHPLVVDGLFGIRTDRALRLWQARRGAPVTGAVSLGDAWHLFGARETFAIVMRRVRASLPTLRSTA